MIIRLLEDRERRIELLRLYAGDLERARDAERWVVWGEITESAGPDTPLCEGAGTTGKPDGPGSVLATPSTKSRSSALNASDCTQPVEPARKDGWAGERGTSSEQEALAARGDVEIEGLSGQTVQKPNETAGAVVTSMQPEIDAAVERAFNKSIQIEDDGLEIPHFLRRVPA